MVITAVLSLAAWLESRVSQTIPSLEHCVIGPKAPRIVCSIALLSALLNQDAWLIGIPARRATNAPTWGT
jgi:hypothetical protein